MAIENKMEKIKQIKDITGCGLAEAKEAIEFANGDVSKAIEIIELNKDPTIDNTYNQSIVDTPIQNDYSTDSIQNNTPCNDVDMSRGTLILYLNDVRIMETIIRASKKRLLNLKRDQQSKQNELERITRMQFRNPPTKGNGVDGDMSGKLALASMYSFIGVLFLFALNYACKLHILLLVAILAIICALLFFASIAFRHAEIKDAELAYNNALHAYSREKENFEKEQKRKIRETREEYDRYMQGYDEAVNTINAEITQMQNLLQQAYSTNIIPLQFRNIEGVYYLYDYLSTSNQSLSEALMQYNLEAIKSKLDNMIKLQSASIIQQAQANAKMDTMIAQNQQILENSKQSKHYAKISAINSEVMAKLSAKSLAYQRADFWLK